MIFLSPFVSTGIILGILGIYLIGHCQKRLYGQLLSGEHQVLRSREAN